MMKIFLQTIFVVEVACAFSPIVRQTNRFVVNSPPKYQHQQELTSKRWMSSQWEDEEEEEEKKISSYEEAGDQLLKQEQEKDFAMTGLVDDPNYMPNEMEQVRAALRQRAKQLGMEESEASKEQIKQLEENAKRRRDAGREAQFLDLSKINGTPTAPPQEDEPATAFFEFDESSLTEEEKDAIDPLRNKPYWEQCLAEMKQAEWPNPFDALKKVILIVAILAGTVIIFALWNDFLYDTSMKYGLIPTQEQIMAGREGLELPEGWADSMNEGNQASYQSSVDMLKDAVNAGIETISKGGVSGGGGLPEL